MFAEGLCKKEESEVKRIYVAGKYDDTSVIGVLNNIKKGTSKCVEILKEGNAPFCPWLDFQFHWFGDLSKEDYQRYSMAWLEVCDELYVLNNWRTSGGTKREIARAKELGIPITYEKDETGEKPTVAAEPDYVGLR